MVGFVLGRNIGIRQLATDAGVDPLAQWRESLAAALLTLVWMLLVAAPLVWLGFNLADHVRDATLFIKDVQVDGLPAPPDWLAGVPLIGERLVGYWNTIDEQGAAAMVAIKPYLGQVGNWLLARSAQVGGGILEITLSLVFVFFFYRDGPRLAAFVLTLLERLIGDRAGYYLDLVAGTVQRVVNGVIGTAAAQAVLAFIGFLIAGVPGALVLGIGTFLLSLVPMGPPLIWIPLPRGWPGRVNTAWRFFSVFGARLLSVASTTCSSLT